MKEERVVTTDDELADRWLAAERARAITHEEHVCIAFSLLRRHGSEAGGRLIDEGTRRNSAALGAAVRYDPELTRRWTLALAEAVAASEAADAEAFLAEHAEFRHSRLFGVPAWMRG